MMNLNGKQIELSEREWNILLRIEFSLFIQRSFYELNPLTTFLCNWHIDDIAQSLEDCRNGNCKRLIINIPPRSLKSHCASIAFPAWVLGHNPSAQIICASYGQDLANTHAMNCRSLMSSAWYRSVFATRLATKQQAINDYYTTCHGFRMATSVGGVLTGRGADFLIIDDPLKPEEAASEVQRKAVNEWFDHTLLTRLNDKVNGCIIIIMQRLHQDDLVGHVLKSSDWKVVRLPAIAEEDEVHVISCLGQQRVVQRKAGEALHPEREPLETLESTRQQLGEYNFAGQYQQNPSPLGGGMIKTQWFQRYNLQTLPSTFPHIIQSWDTANKTTELSDYSVCMTWGILKGKLYLLHVFRKRLDYPNLKRAVLELRRAYGASMVLIEDKASGTQLIQELISEGQYGIARYQSKMDKVMRMYSVTGMIEDGQVYLPDQAGWLDDLVHELEAFPNSKYDDQADSISQALDWIRQCNSRIGEVRMSIVY